MRRITKRGGLWLASATLAGGALLACSDDPTTATSTGVAEPVDAAPSPEQGGGCSDRGSSDDILPGSRRVPRC